MRSGFYYVQVRYVREPGRDFVPVSAGQTAADSVSAVDPVNNNPFLNVGDGATDSFHFFLLLFGRPEFQP